VSTPRQWPNALAAADDRKRGADHRGKRGMGRLEGKVAIITGALGGIGRCDATLFAREGAKLVLTDVSDRGGQEFAASLGSDALFLTHDVSSEEDWIRVVATAEERFGRLDVLVNNAGLILLGSVDQASYADWRRVHAVNLDGPFLGCKHALPAIERAGGGSIVNISSIAAMLGQSFAAAYSEEQRALQFGAPRRREDADGGEGRDRAGGGEPRRDRGAGEAQLALLRARGHRQRGAVPRERRIALRQRRRDHGRQRGSRDGAGGGVGSTSVERCPAEAGPAEAVPRRSEFIRTLSG